MAAPFAVSGLSLACALLALTSLAPAQTRSNGTLSWDAHPAPRAATIDPPLPPDASELAYDSGTYNGNSRNLQNANVQPGWGYWSLSVRFTPTAVAQGQLLEARYLAPAQWGAGAAFDLIVRDDFGQVLANLPGQTAHLDTVNWQVVDLRPLHLVVGSSDFYLEMRPSTPCSGSNGFTLGYSTQGSARSSASDDCSDSFSSFLGESRDYFLRAVIADLPQGPGLTVSNLSAGNQASLQLQGLSAFGQGLVLISGHGAGPTTTPFGNLAVTPPWFTIRFTADAQGVAQRQLLVPAGSSGRSVWMHAVDSGNRLLGQALAATIG